MATQSNLKQEYSPKGGAERGLITLGMRNNNPLNIRRVKGQKWKGEASPQPSPMGEGALPQGGSGNVSSPLGEVGRGAAGPFVHFSSLTYGLRAAFCILRTYRNKHHAVCIEDIITRWAPPTENDTHKYILDVCKLTGFGGKERLTEKDWPELVRAMAFIECGSLLSPEIIKQGYSLFKDLEP